MSYPAETVTIALYTPVTDAAGNTIAQLVMREPKVFDRIKFSYLKGSPEENDASMIADLCGIPMALINTLTVADYRQLEVQFTVFMAPPADRVRLREAVQSAAQKALMEKLGNPTFSAA